MRNNLPNRPTKLSLDRRMLTLIFVICLSVVHIVCATKTIVPIAPEPVGSGARALAQSAFMAVADDATAASWNPAGLINLEKPEASFVGVWRNVTNDYSSKESNVYRDGDSWSVSEINFMSYAYPLVVQSTDLVISVNYHQVYDLGIEFNRVRDIEGDPGPPQKETRKGRWEGAISAYSIAAGLSIPRRPEITIGASLNWHAKSLLNDYVRWGSNITWETEDDKTPKITTEKLDDFRGYNFTFGLLWDVFEKQENLLTLGFVCHTPFTAKLDQEVGGTNNQGEVVATQHDRIEIDFPLSLGAGFNYRLTDADSIAFDIQWTDWSEFEYTNSPSSLDDSLAFRLGFEHLTFLDTGIVRALRYGGFYEPRPVWEDDIMPVYGFSAGLGWTVRESFSLDFAYQFRKGAEELSDFDYGIKEHWFVASLIKYF